MGHTSSTFAGVLFLRTLCHRVRDHLIDQAARYPTAQGPIPATADLALIFNASECAMRKAIVRLVDDGFLVHRDGYGFFLSSEASAWTDCSRGDPSGVIWVTLCLIALASQEERAVLRLNATEEVVRCTRVSEFDDRTLLWQSYSVVRRLLPSLTERDFNSRNPSTIAAQRHGITLKSANENFETVAATSADATAMGVAERAPLVRISRVLTTSDGEPTEWRVTKCDTRNWRQVPESP